MSGFPVLAFLLARPGLPPAGLTGPCGFAAVTAFLFVAVYAFNAWGGRRHDGLNPRLEAFSVGASQASGMLSLALGGGFLGIVGMGLGFGVVSASLAGGIFLLGCAYSHPSLGVKERPVLPTVMHLVSGFLMTWLGWEARGGLDGGGVVLGCFVGLVLAAGHLMHLAIDERADRSAGLATAAVVVGGRSLRLAAAGLAAAGAGLLASGACLGALTAERALPLVPAALVQAWLAAGGDEAVEARRRYRLAFVVAGAAAVLGTGPGLLPTLVIEAALAWWALVAGALLLAHHPSSVRWCGAVAIWAAVQQVLGRGLSVLGARTPGVMAALAVVVLLSLVAVPVPLHALRRVGGSLRRLAQGARGGGGGVGGGAAVVAAVLMVPRLLRSLVVPPLGWDALTYHLPKATLAVQGVSPESLSVPGAWSYYAALPDGLSVLWSQAMGGGAGDALVALKDAVVWCLLVVCVGALARRFGASREGAALCAFGVGTLPVAGGFVGACYPHAAITAFVVAAAVLLDAGCRQGGAGALLLAGAAVGSAASMQLGAAFVAACLCLVVATRVRGRLPVLAGVVACVLVTGVGPYARSWARHGSPVWPFSLHLGDAVVAPGDAELARVRLGGPEAVASRGLEPGDVVTALLWKGYDEDHPHCNLGPWLPVLLGAGLAGLAGRWREGPVRSLVAFVAFVAVATATVFLSSSSSILRSERWAPTAGRVLLPAVALVAAAGGRWRWVGAVGVVVNAVTFPPVGILGEEVGAGALVAGVAAAGVVVAARAVVGLGRGRDEAVTLALVVGCVAVAVLLPPARARLRPLVYAAAAQDPCRAWVGHPLDHRYVGAHHVWRWLDEGPLRRIAVTAGWDGVGHNWFLQPLFGSRCLNELVYVPVVRDGAPPGVEGGPERRSWADHGSWCRRLLAADVSWVVTLPPPPVEVLWMRSNKLVFSPGEGADPGAEALLWQIHRGRLRVVTSRRGGR